MPHPKGAPKVNIAPRLPLLPKLRVKRPNEGFRNPCAGVMSSVLGCWASSGQASQGCQALEQALRACMDAPPAERTKKNDINRQLGRMYPKFMGPVKNKKK